MDRPDVRASDAERERAVELLRDAAAEGRLSFEELADLLVPESVEVEVRSRTFAGSVRQEVGDARSPGAPRIILEDRSVFGDVKVRAKRLSEKLAERLLGRSERP